MPKSHVSLGTSSSPLVRRPRFLVAVAAVFVVALGAGFLLSRPSGPPGAGVGSATPSASGAAGRSRGPSGPPPKPKHEVFGFVPYWEMDGGIAAHLARTDLTTLALFSVTPRKNGSMATNQLGYRRITGELGQRLVREAHARKTRVEVVYSSFGEDKNRPFLGDAAAQARWIAALVAFVAGNDLDGVNVDVERLPPDLVPAYGDFVRRLREALDANAPKAEVSVATQANEVGAAMAAAAGVAGADRIFLMGYDYHYPGSEPGASAPIDRFDGQPKDLAWSLDLYASLGVPVDRTLLGLPLYGVTWPVVGPDVGAASAGRGETWVPRRNLRVFANPRFSPTYEPVESVEFYSVAAKKVLPTARPRGSAASAAPPAASVRPSIAP
ncbi:MAG: glycosyl hydrolase family 18 protein, partial [Chloroflexota bacterium]